MTAREPRIVLPISTRNSDTRSVIRTGKPGESEAGGPHRGTNPGSFANPADIGGPLSFSSPDTPGMPQPSDKTAWDFMPSD